MGFFSDLLSDAHAIYGSDRAIAEHIGKPDWQSNIWRWRNGKQKASVEDAMFVLEKLGGDPSRALPNYHPPTKVQPQTIQGQVAAGALKPAGKRLSKINVPLETWKDSKYWNLTDASAPIVYLEVAGDSMAPYYLDGDIIACRKPASNDAVINNRTPCIFQCRGDYTFKIFYKKKGVVVGRPLNPAYDPVIFSSYEEFSIDFVVLGKIDPGWNSRF